MRWMPLQNINSKNWILSVLHDDCLSYDLTEVQSENVDKILCYIEFMNGGASDGIDPVTLDKLLRLKEQYGVRDDVSV